MFAHWEYKSSLCYVYQKQGVRQGEWQKNMCEYVVSFPLLFSVYVCIIAKEQLLVNHKKTLQIVGFL